MEKGVTKEVSFLCIIIASAITMGVVVAYAMGPERDYKIRDPTYQEALQFIYSDQTDKNQYTENYTCVNFASDFGNNALNKGYRCGRVIIEFQESRHAIVCFNTSDNGLIFIEPQNDEIVTVSIEQPYSGRMILRFSITWPIVSRFPSVLVLPLIFLSLLTTSTVLTVTIYRTK